MTDSLFSPGICRSGLIEKRIFVACAGNDSAVHPATTGNRSIALRQLKMRSPPPDGPAKRPTCQPRSFKLTRTKFGTVCALFWLVLLAAPTFGAESAAWICDGKFGLCRYVDLDTSREIIPARFQGGMPFSEGLAAVRIGGRFGYVNARGELVIQPQFDLASPFARGLAEVVVGDKAGAINQKGEIVVPLMFRRAVPLTKEIILAVEGSWNDHDHLGFERFPGEAVSDLQNPGLYHVAGYWIRRPNLKRARVFNREDGGLAWAREPGSDLYGLLASDGEWVIRPQFEYVGELRDGRAIVHKRVNDVVLSGAVDGKGQLVVPLRPWTLFDWRNGWAVARESHRGGKQALIDRDGNIVGGRYFDEVERGEQGDVAKVLIDGRWSGLDRSGNIVANPDNGRVIADCPNGVRATIFDGKVQITDAGGQPTVTYLFEPLGPKPTCDKPFPVNFNGSWSFVGVDGRLLFDPPPFRDQHDFEEGYAAVFDGYKWGIIDTSGRFALPMKFDKYLGRRGELFHVVTARRDIWLTATGEERPSPPIAPPILNCGHGLRLAERGGLWGIVDADGTDVIAPRYRALECFRNGTSWAAIDSRRQWCALGPDGIVQDKPACHTEHYLSVQTHSEPEMFDNDPFANSVLWSRAYLEFGAGRRERRPQWIARGISSGVRGN